MKKVVVGLLVAALVAVGVMGGTVLAQSADENAVKSFAERVAEILGLDSATVENAMEQAKSDIAEERAQAWLDKMVAADKATQEQADAYMTWYEARPEDVGDKLSFDFNPTARADLEVKLALAVTAGSITQAQADAYLARYESASDMADELVQAWLDKMVAADKMTQEQADAYSTWYESRPEGVGAGFDYKKGRGDHRGFGHKKGRGDHRWFDHEKNPEDYDWGEKDSYDWGEKDSDSATLEEAISL